MRDEKGHTLAPCQTGQQTGGPVTPKTSRSVVEETANGLRVYVTCVPENGKANKAVVKLFGQAQNGVRLISPPYH
ncbi:MAG: DUF167 domain-containing protein [Rhodobacteraceae bacterium]|nr:DUF167 domain-containing protein [Paracoccaceae bacterium]